MLFLFTTFTSVFSQSIFLERKFSALTTLETPSYILHFEYDNKGNVVSETKEAFEDDYLSYIYEYEYDEIGNITLLTHYGFYFFFKEENDYNEDNQLVEKREYLDYGQGFKYIAKHRYEYRDSLIEKITSQIINSSGQSINSTHKEFFYNDNEQLLQMKNYDWVMGNWIHTALYSYEYNDNGKVLYYSCELLQGDHFEKCWRYAFIYNNAGQIIERQYQIAQYSNWLSTPLERLKFQYEDIKDDETILYPNIYQFDELQMIWFQAETKLVKDSLWIADCSFILHFKESAHYSYQLITVSTPDRVIDYSMDDIMIFPNPTRGELTIEMCDMRYEICDIMIYDVYGRKIPFLWRGQGVVEISNLKIDFSNLHAGIYFVKITTNSGFITKKILKL
jgi:hypothetical protein